MTMKVKFEKVITLRQGMPLAMFEDGRMAGDERGWQLVKEEIMRRFYAGESPPLGELNLEWARKLAPECTLDGPCSTKRGLRLFFDTLKAAFIDADFPTLHIPHSWSDFSWIRDTPQVERKNELRVAGIRAEEVTPESDPYRFNEDSSPAAIKTARNNLIAQDELDTSVGGSPKKSVATSFSDAALAPRSTA
ncbi:hypothetical protein JCM11641_000648 [Rhodosporidiobolus odoratus]